MRRMQRTRHNKNMKTILVLQLFCSEASRGLLKAVALGRLSMALNGGFLARSSPIRCFPEPELAVITTENSLCGLATASVASDPGNSRCGLATASVAWPQPLWPGHSLCGLATASVAWPQSLWSGNSLCGVAAASLVTSYFHWAP